MWSCVSSGKLKMVSRVVKVAKTRALQRVKVVIACRKRRVGPRMGLLVPVLAAQSLYDPIQRIQNDFNA